MRFHRFAAVVLALGFSQLPLGAVTFAETTLYVSPTGDDSAAGTETEPFATLQRAQKAAREARAGGPVTVYLRAGTHYLPETLVLTDADSGTAAAPVTYTSFPGEQAVVSGGTLLDLTWEEHNGPIRRARVPAGFRSDQLFVGGERQPLARYPDFDPAVRIFGGHAADAISKERAARWKDPRGGFIHAMHRNMWGDFHYVITAKKADDTLEYEGGWQNNRRYGMHGKYRFVENIFEELDTAGEWYLDEREGWLYYSVPEGVDLASAPVEAVRLRHLIELRGTRDAPVRHVRIIGLTFRHAARTFMDNREPLLRSDWTTYRGGALFFNGTEDCALSGCTIDQVGGNAVFVNKYNRRVTIQTCRISEAGANAVAFVGNPDAVRSPLFEYSERQTYESMDKERGPKSDDFPADCLVDDCLIYRSGRVEKQTAGVQISMAQGITVRATSIYDLPRAGINISEGTWGGHVIEFCDVFDTVKETGDHGSFNSWGRDRFWGLKDLDLNDADVFERRREVPLLDVVEPVIIRNSRWRCDHGWDIDLDDGSTNYRLYNNLCLNGGIKLREGFYRLVENNIMVNNSFHPHVWYRYSQDVFRKNIVFTKYRPIRVPKPWGKEIDRNFLHTPGAALAPTKVLAGQSGRDENSVTGDAGFVDEASGDYRLRDDSQAAKAIGFESFPMDRFGVRSKHLRRIARTPRLPEMLRGAPAASTAADSSTRWWRGAKVKNIETLGERSAAGLAAEEGVRLLEIPKGSRAARLGLQKEDVIIAFGNRKARTLRELQTLEEKLGPDVTAKLRFVRAQHEHDVDAAGVSRIWLRAADAKPVGEGRKPVYDSSKDFLGSWSNAGVKLRWKRALAPGRYEVRIVIACNDGSAGATYDVTAGSESVRAKVRSTGDWERFVDERIGHINLSFGGIDTIELNPVTKPKSAVMNLRAVVLEKVD